MTSYCGKHPHMPSRELEKLRVRPGGKSYLVHYEMLCAAAQGCVQCVKRYHEKVRCVPEGSPAPEGIPASVWDGSLSDPLFNAWRSTFENQSAALFAGQESVRAFLLGLDNAQEHIDQTQHKWKQNKLLGRWRELKKQADERQSSQHPDESQGKRRSLGRNKIDQQGSVPFEECGLKEADQGSGIASFLQRIQSQASGSLPQGGRQCEAQSEPQPQSSLDRPACRMCENVSCGSRNSHVIYLGPFWRDVSIPGLANLAPRILLDTESITLCKTCTERLISECDLQMREITATRCESSGVWKEDRPCLFQRLGKAHLIILAQWKQQCVRILLQ